MRGLIILFKVSYQAAKEIAMATSFPEEGVRLALLVTGLRQIARSSLRKKDYDKNPLCPTLSNLNPRASMGHFQNIAAFTLTLYIEQRREEYYNNIGQTKHV